MSSESNSNQKIYYEEDFAAVVDAQKWGQMTNEGHHQIYLALWNKYMAVCKEFKAYKQAVEKLNYEDARQKKLELYFNQILASMESTEEEKKRRKKEEKRRQKEIELQKAEEMFGNDDDECAYEGYQRTMNPEIRKNILRLRWENKQLLKKKEIEELSEPEEGPLLIKKKIQPMAEEQLEKIHKNIISLEEEFERQQQKQEEEEELEEPEKDIEYEKQHKKKIQDFVDQFLSRKVLKEPTKEEIEHEEKMKMTKKIRKHFEEEENSEKEDRFTHNSDGVLCLKTPNREYNHSPIRYTKEEKEEHHHLKKLYKEVKETIPKDENENIFMSTIKKETQIFEEIAKKTITEDKLKFKENSNLQHLVKSGVLSKDFEFNLKSKEHSSQIQIKILKGTTIEQIENNMADKDIKDLRIWFLSQGSQERFEIKTIKKKYTKITKGHLMKIIKYFEEKKELQFQKGNKWIVLNKQKMLENQKNFREIKEENIYLSEIKEEKEPKEEEPKEEEEENNK